MPGLAPLEIIFPTGHAFGTESKQVNLSGSDTDSLFCNLKMNIQEYFKSLTEELQSLKNRVRNFIDTNHWLTDGEWKESVIRYFLKRNLPGTVKVGRGFIIDCAKTSHQIDILIYDDSKPVLFRDGDLVFVTPEYQNICNTDRVTAFRDLKDLVEKEIIRKIGKTGKWTYYEMKR